MVGNSWHFERKRVHRSLHTPKGEPGVKVEILNDLTSFQVVETSVTITDNSPCQDYTHPDDQTTLLHVNLYCTKLPVILSRRSAATSFLCIFVPRDSSSNVPRTKTIDSRMLKFDNLIITNIRASRFHTSLQGPFARKKTWLSHHDNFLIWAISLLWLHP